MKRIGLIVNHSKPEARQVVRTIAQLARDTGLSLFADSRTVALIGAGKGVRACPVARFPGRVDGVMVLGGDGTMLSAAHRLHGSGLPLIGLNIGDLGYLTSVEASRAQEALTCLRDGRYTVSRRTTLENLLIHSDGRRVKMLDALNDLVVSRGASGRAVRLALSLDGIPVTTYVCDGIIVSTPTGSTAYALSAGGPIVMPGTGAWVIAVISPHTLTSRPLVVPDSTVVGIEVIKSATPLVASVDGQDDVTLDIHARVEIRRSKHDVPVIHLPDYDAYSLLSRKLGWGGR